MGTIDYQEAFKTMLAAAFIVTSNPYTIVEVEEIAGQNYPVAIIAVPGDFNGNLLANTGSFNCLLVEAYDLSLNTNKFLCDALNRKAISVNAIALIEALQGLYQSNADGYLVFPTFTLADGDIGAIGPEADCSLSNVRSARFAVHWGLKQ